MVQGPGAGERLDQLDGLRGVAALTVVVHHFISRQAPPFQETALYPHGDLTGWVPTVQFWGDFGVLLFFLISGFVIMLTLERSSGILDFAGRRIARLWPAMLVCATLSALAVNLSGMSDYYGFDSEASWFDWFFSILFVPPDLVAEKLGLTLADTPYWVEGVYWTLWYEVRFYALVAVIFLLASRRWFLWAWVGVQAASFAVFAIPAVMPELRFRLFWPELALMPAFLGWFGLGICGYMVWTRRVRLPMILIALIAFAQLWLRPVLRLVAPEQAAMMTPQGMGIDPAAYPAILAVFAMFLARLPVMRILTWRPLLAIGLASYPLYLFHEKPGLIVFMLAEQAGLPAWVGLVAAFGLVIGAALLIHRLVEMPGKRLILGAWIPRAKGIERRVGLLRYAPPAVMGGR